MIIEAQVSINSTLSDVWAVVTDIENSADFLSGVERIEIVQRPATGLVGLRWRETRIYFGKPATVEKQITEVVENEYYKSRAEDSGFVFITKMSLADIGGGIVLTSSHDTQPQGIISKLKSTPMFLFKGVIRKALMRDLDEIKARAEKI